MSIQTPNMNLIQPTIRVDSGLTWEQSANANSAIVDIHNHTPGYGVQIPPSGLNISSSLTFNNQQAINLQASVFTQQSSLSTLNALFVGTDGNLYFNDGIGDPSIQITAAGAVNSTSSGIVSGSATAGFVSSVLVVNAATNTPANIQGGSVLLGNNSLNSKFLTLSPPASMTSNYTITLPSAANIAAGPLFLTIDTSGNITTALIEGSDIASTTITGSNIAAATIATANLAVMPLSSTTVAAGGIGITADCGNFSTNSGTPVAVTNLSITITSTGRPIFIGLQTVGTNVDSGVGVANSVTANIWTYKNGTAVNRYVIGPDIVTAPPSLLLIDTPAAGTNTYAVYLSSYVGGGGSVAMEYVSLVAYEL